MNKTQRARPPLIALLPVLVCAACASSTTSKTSGPKPPDKDVRPIEEIVEATKKPSSIGKFLTDVNLTIKAWQNLFLAASTDTDKSKARLLEKNLSMVTHDRRAELIHELESGPLNNRIIAGAALGFTHDDEALSPLLAALDDQHEEVVASALLGLWLLNRPDTPLDKICPLVQPGRSEQVRTNAALCLASLLQAGAKADCVLPVARYGILDEAPTVRAQCALILANQKDTESILALADRLSDDKPLVVSAAARGLQYLGTEEPRVKGQAARALVKAWIPSKDPARAHLFKAMVGLAGSNFGSDEEEWIKWAQRLP